MNTARLPRPSPDGLYKVAIVGAASLKGKELGELLPEAAFLASDVKLLDDEESLGQLEAVGDEINFVQSVQKESFDNSDVVFFASEPDQTLKSWPLAMQAGSTVVDLSYALESAAGATIRSPWISMELGEQPSPQLQPGPVVVAHPAAVVLSLLLLRARALGQIRSAVTTVFEPASERGRRGLDELHGQTVNLLSFQSLPKEVFDAQIAFNMVQRFGEASATMPLESTEKRIAAHLKRITGGRVVMPSLMLLQAPVFHGYGFSLHLEFATALSVEQVAEELAGDHVAIIKGEEEGPSAVAAAGQGEIMVTIRRDVQRETGLWIWAAADNLRVQALNAIGCAEQLVAARPKGKVQ